MLMHFFSRDHEDTAQHQTDDDCHGTKERILDKSMKTSPRRQAGNMAMARFRREGPFVRNQ